MSTWISEGRSTGGQKTINVEGESRAYHLRLCEVDGKVLRFVNGLPEPEFPRCKLAEAITQRYGAYKAKQ